MAARDSSARFFTSVTNYLRHIHYPYFRFLSKEMHKFWQRGQETNLTFLEFGGGPSIYPLISAAPHLKHIVFSDYDFNCLKAIDSWRKKEEGAFDWTPIVKYVVTELEGNDDEEIVGRQHEIREKIRAVVHCDIHKEDIIDTASLPMELRPPYDVVSTNLCLNACTNSKGKYIEALCKVTELIKPGGYLLYSDGGEETYFQYHNETEKHHTFYITKELVMEALDSAGLEVLSYECAPLGAPDTFSDAKFVFFVAAKRMTNK